MEAVNHRDHAIEPVAAVEAVGHRQDDDREQKKQIQEHHAAPGFRRHRKPPVMAEPEQAGDDEADRQRDDRLRIDANQVDPGGRLLEAAGFRQIIGEQRHGNAEDGVAQHLQPAHFEKMGLRQCAPLASPVRRRFRFAQAMPDTLRPDGLRVAAPRVARQGEAWCGRPGSNRHSPFEPRDFLTSYGFRRLAAGANAHRPVCGLDYTFTVGAFAPLGAARLVSTPSHQPLGLGAWLGIAM